RDWSSDVCSSDLATGLLVANAGIQGGNHADDADGTLAVRQRYRGKIVVQHGEIGSGIPHLHLISHQGDRISLESHDSRSFLSHASFPPFQIVLPPFFHLITRKAGNGDPSPFTAPHPGQIRLFPASVREAGGPR